MTSAQILCLGTTPATQRVMVFRHLVVDAVNRAATTLDGVAGKSVNVAKVLKVLGEKPVAMGFAGGDRGEQVLRELADRGIEIEFIPVAGRTRQCITVVDEARGAIMELVEEGRPVAPDAYDKLLAALEKRLPDCRALVMSGTIPPGGPPDLYARGVHLARGTGALSVVDAQGPALLEALKVRPGLVKPNRAELAATTGRELKDESAIASAMRDLHGTGAERVVVTAGKEATLAFDGRRLWRIHPPQIHAVNPIGSGDAFTAGLVWRLSRGEDLGEACRWAAAVGAANALTLMPGEVDPAEVQRLSRDVVVDLLEST